MTSAQRRRRRGQVPSEPGEKRSELRPRPHPLAATNERGHRLPRLSAEYERHSLPAALIEPQLLQSGLVLWRGTTLRDLSSLSAAAHRTAHDMSQVTWTGKRTNMLPEIAAAVGFLSSLLRTRGCVSEQRLKVFSRALQEALTGEPAPRGPGPSHPTTRAQLSSLPVLLPAGLLSE